MPQPAHLVVEYLKWPSDLHYRVEGEVLRHDHFGTWIGIRPGATVDRGAKGSYEVGGLSITFIPTAANWTARWHSFPGPDAAGRAGEYACYVDITTPADHRPDKITVVDLDLDVVRRWDGAVLVLDEDEFERHRLTRSYPQDLVEVARAAANDLSKRIASCDPPFDGSHLKVARDWATSWREGPEASRV